MTATTDINTEILTQSGWKNPDKILPDDLALSLDGKYHIWSQASIDIRHYSGQMVSIDCNSLQALLTANSEVMCKIRKKNAFGDMQNITFQKPTSYQICIPSVSFAKESSCTLTDDQIRLAGWLMTDGGFHLSKDTPYWIIYQSKPSHEIERVLESNNIKYSLSVRDRNITHVCGTKLKKKPLPSKEFNINTASTRDVLNWVPSNIKSTLPKWFLDLSDRQFDVLLDALIQGDGSKYKNKECYILYGKYQLLSNIQYIALMHGWRAIITVAREKDFRLNLCRQQGVEFKPKKAIKYQKYSGLVWSAKTNAQNLLVRRNGTPYFLPTN